jgi:hypothetical protein
MMIAPELGRSLSYFHARANFGGRESLRKGSPPAAKTVLLRRVILCLCGKQGKNVT